ncbi:hypothetical protein ACTMTJ_15105 [Phytohabitans sp. LJ34]|uniref:hypothetical protein n=1 Tax=Phytohabitans sp. LJ34 TaxID=3452217 RepID=UPI003F8A1122
MPARGLRATLLTAALTTAATLAAAAPAHAADPIAWNMAPCATAILSEAQWDQGARMFVVNGVATQCAPVASSGGVRIATYKPTAASASAPGYNVRLFPDATPGATRPFGVAAVPPTVGEYGVCVLAGAQERVVCALVTVSSYQGRLVAPMSPLPVDAPLVDKPVVTTPYTGALAPPAKDGGPGGTCGTCF